jgi:hypothetical protein
MGAGRLGFTPHHYYIAMNSYINMECFSDYSHLFWKLVNEKIDVDSSILLKYFLALKKGDHHSLMAQEAQKLMLV